MPKLATVRYKLKGGMLQSVTVGGKVWNPVKSGVTNRLLWQFNRYRSFETPKGDIEAATHPVEFAISYNNTDFPPSPSYTQPLNTAIF